MRRLQGLAFVVLGACATQDVDDFSHTARFPTFPSALFAALEQSCADPAQDFSRETQNIAECREYLDPESTAAIILTYDGTPKDLPQLVIRFRAWPDETEYLMRTDMFLDVPQKSSGSVQVAFSTRQFNRKLRERYKLSGGIPE
jgi:hypothetical protein